VADKTRRPLYYLQAEDLGTNPSILGPKIKKVFEMATEWNAVVLLDEVSKTSTNFWLVTMISLNGPNRPMYSWLSALQLT
jgi:hypothetical protein